ncbi:hypothetical protein [Rhodococcoides fascians]|uniref:hypothetical protein n=1 Tax=Rhodococcoides fascians TaxID=1828 RepID=UPI00055E2A05|nr:hypothetical protein [Rhodococcus fascians]
MNIGDRFHIAPGATSVVIIRELHNDNGLVMVEHEIPGTGVYPYLTKPDHFIPATTQPPTPAADDEPGPARQQPAVDSADSYLNELNNT